MSIFKNKKNDLYLSDKQPLTVDICCGNFYYGREPEC